MIKYFRKIRKKLLTENKFSKYLLYAIGEIILVVVGILIAVQLNNQNEFRKQKLIEIDILDFVPLTNVDYGGGIIVTDWYSDSSSNNESVKIMVQFLSNEIRSDGLKINIYKKDCSPNGNCKTQILKTKLNTEIKLAILKKAASLKKESLTKKK